MLAVGSLNSIEQNSTRHLIVKRRLIDENDICIIHHQYPNVKYLELLFPLREERFLSCLKLFSILMITMINVVTRIN